MYIILSENLVLALLCHLSVRLISPMKIGRFTFMMVVMVTEQNTACSRVFAAVKCCLCLWTLLSQFVLTALVSVNTPTLLVSGF